jgi:hypothetical protein
MDMLSLCPPSLHLLPSPLLFPSHGLSAPIINIMLSPSPPPPPPLTHTPIRPHLVKDVWVALLVLFREAVNSIAKNDDHDVSFPVSAFFLPLPAVPSPFSFLH